MPYDQPCIVGTADGDPPRTGVAMWAVARAVGASYPDRPSILSTKWLNDADGPGDARSVVVSVRNNRGAEAIVPGDEGASP